MKRFERLLGVYKEWSEGLIVGVTVTQAILWLYLYIYPMPWLLPVGIVAGLVTSYVGKYRKTKALITATVLVFITYVLYVSWVANTNYYAGLPPNSWMWSPSILGVGVLVIAFLLAMIYLFKTHTTIDNTLKALIGSVGAFLNPLVTSVLAPLMIYNETSVFFIVIAMVLLIGVNPVGILTQPQPNIGFNATSLALLVGLLSGLGLTHDAYRSRKYSRIKYWVGLATIVASTYLSVVFIVHTSSLFLALSLLGAPYVLYALSNYTQEVASPPIGVVLHREVLSDIAGTVVETSALDYVSQLIDNVVNSMRKGSPLGNGVMLYGEPGVGKTVMAYWVAFELMRRAPDLFKAVVELNSSDFFDPRFGVSESLVSELFNWARQVGAVIIIDEAERLFMSRSLVQSDEPMRTIVATVLAEMGKPESAGKVFVIATTNEIEKIDPATLRPGRFVTAIKVPPLAVHELDELLTTLARKYGITLPTTEKQEALRHLSTPDEARAYVVCRQSDNHETCLGYIINLKRAKKEQEERRKKETTYY
jgi:uncharacterized membrane protein (DUF485 family)